MRKTILCIIVISAALMWSFSPPAGTAGTSPAIAVSIDGLSVHFDVQPAIQNGRTLVPFRALSEALRVNVQWDDTGKTVTATGLNTTVRLQIGNKTAYVNGSAVALEAPPVLLQGRTLIPLRFFSEAFGCDVAWIPSTGAVNIISPPRDMTVTGFYALGDSQTSSWTNLFGKPFPETGTGHADLISTLALGWYSLDPEGKLLTQSSTGWQRPESWEKVLETAEEYKIKTELVVHLTDKDSAIVNMLSSQSAVQLAIGDIVREADLYQGVNLDFEGLGWQEEGTELESTRNLFTDFTRQLARQLKAKGSSLTLTLHPPNSAYKGYDYKALGENADNIIIMAYDYGSRPEPVDMVVQAVESAISAVPPGKLVLGISAPSETPDSILAKIGLAKKYNLGGIAIWRLGLVSDGMWATLGKSVKVPKQ